MKPSTPILYGTAYYPDHWPESDWERDLQNIRDSGIQVVRFGEFSWAWFEPQPGQFAFRSYDHFMELADKTGLKVLLCTPTCNPPRWFFFQHPDARMLDQHDQPHIGHRHMTNYNHPAAAKAAECVIRVLAERYRHHPALYGWQIDNELTAGESTDPNRIYDYHLLTLAKFRRYLENKYQTLDALNTCWLNNFWSNQVGDWEQIDPPRPGRSGSINPSVWLDWCRFREKNVADFARQQIDWLRSIESGFYLTTNIPDLSPRLSIWLGQDYWNLSRGFDLVGLTRYNYCGDAQTEYRALAYSLDVIRAASRSAGARFGVLEMQGGPHILPWRMTFAGGVWAPDFLERSMVTSAEHGAEEIYFFLWRGVRGGAEIGMNSLASMDGSPSPRTRALSAFQVAAEANRGKWESSPTAVVHYSQDSIRLGALFDPDHTVDRCLPGWHALLEDLGYRVEFVDDDGLLEKLERAQGDERIVLPYSLSLNTPLRWALFNSRAQVWVGPATGFFDQNAHVNLPPAADELQSFLGIGFRGFNCDCLLTFPGLPPSRGYILQALVETLQNSAPDLVHTTPSTVYLTFDLGTYYAGLSHAEQQIVKEWAENTLDFKKRIPCPETG